MQLSSLRSVVRDLSGCSSLSNTSLKHGLRSNKPTTAARGRSQPCPADVTTRLGAWLYSRLSNCSIQSTDKFPCDRTGTDLPVDMQRTFFPQKMFSTEERRNQTPRKKEETKHHGRKKKLTRGSMATCEERFSHKKRSPRKKEETKHHGRKKK